MPSIASPSSPNCHNKRRLRSHAPPHADSLNPLPPKSKSPRRTATGTPKSAATGNDIFTEENQPKLQTLEHFKPVWNPRDGEQLRVVKEALHLSTAPSAVVCSEEEQNVVLGFCKVCIEHEKAGSLYVCGCPGTGKSLSMEKVKENLLGWAREEGFLMPDVLSVNCTSLANTSDIFTKIFGLNQPRGKKVLATPLKHVFSEIVYQEYANFVFVYTGVANAIDLADRFLPGLTSLNCKPIVVTFRAYSKDQILGILEERLNELPYTIFQCQALELCARKVAAASGDMRKALFICRSAIETLEAEIRESACNLNTSLEEKSCFEQNLDTAPDAMKKQDLNIVRIDHMALALSKTYRSPVVDTIQSLPHHQQIILCSSIKHFHGAKKDTILGELYRSYTELCKSSLIPPAGILEFSNMCRVLNDQGLIKLGQARDDKLTRVTPKVDEGDITFALQGIRFFRNCLQ